MAELPTLLQAIVPVLGRALLHFLWQGALIGLLAAVALQLLRAAKPQARYAVSCIALLACLLLPLAGVLLALAGLDVPAASAAVHVAASATPAPLDSAAWPSRLAGWQAPALHGGLPLVVSLWAAGASVLSLRLALGVAWIRRLHATAQGPAHAAWQARLDALAQRFGLTRPVTLRLVDTLGSPAAAGWWRPLVLLPTALIARMPADLIEALLAHELAHVRRHDYLVNLLQGVVEALLFYHPVTWWLSRRIRIEREHIADQLAAEVTGAPRRLALALSELADFTSVPQHPAHALPHLAQAAHGGQLMTRIEQLVRPPQRATAGRVAFPLLGLAAACIALYAQAQVGHPTPAPTPAATSVAAPTPAPVATPQPRAQPVAQAQARAAQVTRIHGDSTRDAFALVRKDREGLTMSGSSDDIDAIEAARDRIDRDFLWFRRAGDAYVVTDPATVARAQAAWREVDRLSPQMEALGAQMAVHGDKMEGLGEKMERLAARQQPSPRMQEAEEQMHQLADRQRALAARQMRLAADMASVDATRRDALDAQMETLNTQMEEFSRQMEQHGTVLEAESRQLQANAAPMEALGRQMEAAGKPMEALGKQMEVLGKQQEQHVQRAERELQQLISQAIAQGLASPAPVQPSRQ